MSRSEMRPSPPVSASSRSPLQTVSDTYSFHKHVFGNAVSYSEGVALVLGDSTGSVVNGGDEAVDADGTACLGGIKQLAELNNLGIRECRVVLAEQSLNVAIGDAPVAAGIGLDQFLVDLADDGLVEGLEFLGIDVHASDLLLVEVEGWDGSGGSSCGLNRSKEVRIGSSGSGADGGLSDDASVECGLSRYPQGGDSGVHGVSLAIVGQNKVQGDK